MKARSLDDYGKLFEEAKERLKEMGRPTLNEEQMHNIGGLICDFELPYSSLPAISRQRWKS